MHQGGGRRVEQVGVVHGEHGRPAPGIRVQAVDGPAQQARGGEPGRGIRGRICASPPNGSPELAVVAEAK
ncbi:hypothetical protein Asp14428_34580 [Actinoplanes sp. NBRC 14428]|nr:hypothetical protein Asp14428_34580 [Actinoplanes sp. NBRC 14428]